MPRIALIAGLLALWFGGHAGTVRAAESYRMDAIVLLLPEAVFAERVSSVQAMSDYVGSINEAVTQRLAAERKAVSSGGRLFIAVRPGRRSRVWLQFDPALPKGVEAALRKAAEAVPALTVTGGTVVFALNVSLGGATAPTGMPGPLPEEWMAAVRSAGRPMDAAQIAEAAWE